MNTALPVARSFDGHLVSLISNRLVRMDSSGQQHVHLLAADTSITCDGLPCRANQLQAGQRIRITNKPHDPVTASHVEALSTHDRFASQDASRHVHSNPSQ
jgi:hypothetical protein